VLEIVRTCETTSIETSGPQGTGMVSRQAGHEPAAALPCSVELGVDFFITPSSDQRLGAKLHLSPGIVLLWNKVSWLSRSHSLRSHWDCNWLPVIASNCLLYQEVSGAWVFCYLSQFQALVMMDIVFTNRYLVIQNLIVHTYDIPDKAWVKSSLTPFQTVFRHVLRNLVISRQLSIF